MIEEDKFSPKNSGVPTQNKFVRNLATYVFVAIALGILVGHFFPEIGIKTEFIGTWFLYIIEPLIQPLIFLTIIIGIANVGNIRRVGRLGFKTIVYFEVVTTLAMLSAIGMGFLLQPGKIDKNYLNIADAGSYAASHFNNDWLQFLVLNRPLLLLIVAVIIGLLLNVSEKKYKLVPRIEKFRAVLYSILIYVFYLIPFAAFSGMAYSVSKFGINSLLPLGKLVAATYITMALFIVVVFGLVLKRFKISLWKFLISIKEEILVVFGTSSSRAAFPLIVAKLEKMGCGKLVTGFVVPLGYSFNLTGASIFLPMSVIFIAQLYDIPLLFTDILFLLLVLTFTTKIASGIPGSGFIALSATLSILHKFPMEGLIFLFSIDKFMNEARTLTNFIGNAVAVVVISKLENDFISNEEINIKTDK